MNKEQRDPHFLSAAIEALEHFPVDARDIRFVARSENVTFRVIVRDGDSDYVLRLHRPGYNSIEELNSERAWTRALQVAGLPVPASLSTHRGEHFHLVEIPGTGEQCYVGMTTWIEGLPLCDHLESVTDRAERKSIFHEVGGIAAAVHNQSTRWNEPEGFDRRRLDVAALIGDNPFWGRFWEHSELSPAESKLLLKARSGIRDALTAYGEQPGKFSLIHADLNPENIIYDRGDLAMIDFDDSAYGWHMYEIAAALFECSFSPDFDAACEAMLDGYREHRELTDQDVDMLPVFLLIRGMALTGWFHERPEHNGSDFFQDMKNWVVNHCVAYA